MQTIVELPEYERRASTLLNDSEKQGIINYLAIHPHSGVVMQGTGGIRKFRWASGNRGKSGGVRVIYYFHNESTNQRINESTNQRINAFVFINAL